MKKYFDGVKSSAEARIRFFSIVENKGKDEVKEIVEEYNKVVQPMIERELKENDGWLTSDPLE